MSIFPLSPGLTQAQDTQLGVLTNPNFGCRAEQWWNFVGAFSPNDASAARTYMGWIKPRSWGANGNMTVVSNYNPRKAVGIAEQRGVRVIIQRLSGAYYLTFAVTHRSSTFSFVKKILLTTAGSAIDTWFHYVISYYPTGQSASVPDAYFYVNGKPVSATITANTLLNTHDIVATQSWMAFANLNNEVSGAYESHYRGKCAETRIMDGIVTAEAAAYFYNNGKIGQSGMRHADYKDILHWRFNRKFYVNATVAILRGEAPSPIQDKNKIAHFMLENATLKAVDRDDKDLPPGNI